MTIKQFLKELENKKIKFTLTETVITTSYRTKNPILVRAGFKAGIASNDAYLNGVALQKRSTVPALEVNGKIYALKKFTLKRTIINRNFEKLLNIIEKELA